MGRGAKGAVGLRATHSAAPPVLMRFTGLATGSGPCLGRFFREPRGEHLLVVVVELRVKSDEMVVKCRSPGYQAPAFARLFDCASPPG